MKSVPKMIRLPNKPSGDSSTPNTKIMAAPKAFALNAPKKPIAKLLRPKYFAHNVNPLAPATMEPHRDN